MFETRWVLPSTLHSWPAHRCRQGHRWCHWRIRVNVNIGPTTMAEVTLVGRLESVVQIPPAAWWYNTTSSPHITTPVSCLYTLRWRSPSPPTPVYDGGPSSCHHGPDTSLLVEHGQLQGGSTLGIQVGNVGLLFRVHTRADKVTMTTKNTIHAHPYYVRIHGSITFTVTSMLYTTCSTITKWRPTVLPRWQLHRLPTVPTSCSASLPNGGGKSMSPQCTLQTNSAVESSLAARSSMYTTPPVITSREEKGWGLFFGDRGN